MSPEVLNKRTDKIPADAVYVGRPSKWGNPYKLPKEEARMEVLDKYRAWLLGQPELIAQAKQELRGKDLVCWCAPLPCHANILMEIANEP